MGLWGMDVYGKLINIMDGADSLGYCVDPMESCLSKDAFKLIVTGSLLKLLELIGQHSVCFSWLCHNYV